MPKAWIVLTASDLEDYLVAAQVSALRTAALGDSQGDPFDSVMPDVVARIRAEIDHKWTLSATANSVPPEMKFVAAYLTIEAMQARVPGLRLSEEQRELIKDARDYLRRVAEGDLRPTDPTDPETAESAQGGGSVQVVSSKSRRFTRTSLDGL